MRRKAGLEDRQEEEGVTFKDTDHCLWDGRVRDTSLQSARPSSCRTCCFSVKSVCACVKQDTHTEAPALPQPVIHPACCCHFAPHHPAILTGREVDTKDVHHSCTVKLLLLSHSHSLAVVYFLNLLCHTLLLFPAVSGGRNP